MSYESLRTPEIEVAQKSVENLNGLVDIAPFYPGEVHGSRTGSFNFDIKGLHTGFISYSQFNSGHEVYDENGVRAHLHLGESIDDTSSSVSTYYRVTEGYNGLAVTKRVNLQLDEDRNPEAEKTIQLLARQGIPMTTALYIKAVSPGAPKPKFNIEPSEEEKSLGLDKVSEQEVQKLIKLMKLGMANHKKSMITKDSGSFLLYFVRQKVFGEVVQDFDRIALP